MKPVDKTEKPLDKMFRLLRTECNEEFAMVKAKVQLQCGGLDKIPFKMLDALEEEQRKAVEMLRIYRAKVEEFLEADPEWGPDTAEWNEKTTMLCLQRALEQALQE